MDSAADIILRNLVLVPVGVVIATVASLLGIGGGLLWAPFLILVRMIDPPQAIMLSLLIQVAGMGSASLFNVRRGTIYWKLVVLLLPFIGAGALLGSFISQRVAGERLLEMGLGGISIAISLYFAFKTEKFGTKLNPDRSILPTPRIVAPGALFGFLSGLFSIGVSDFLIPLMRSRLKIPMINAIGSAIFINFSIAAMSGVFHAALYTRGIGADLTGLLLCAWAGALIGGQIGPRLSARIEDERLKEIFIFALFLIGIHLIYQSL